jgi:hypothetical protein
VQHPLEQQSGRRNADHQAKSVDEEMFVFGSENCIVHTTVVISI